MKSKASSITALIFALCMAFALVGCGTKPSTLSGVADLADSSASVDTAGASESPSDPSITQESIVNFPTTSEADFNVEVMDNGVSITGCKSTADVIVVPETIQNMPVVSIGPGGLAQMPMKALVLPDSVTDIEHAAFNSCDRLQYVHLGKGLKTIDSMAFGGCASLVRVEFPEGMTTIYTAPFYNCSNLTEVVIPESVTEIERGILSAMTCPNAVVITPAGSTADSVARESDIPVQNP